MGDYINQAYAINARNRARTRPAAVRIRTGFAGFLRRAAGTLTRWQQRADGRRALLSLDARTLSDIGISRADAVREADKPFWRD